MAVLFSGLVHFVSAPDAGKTTAALECGSLRSQIAFLESDVKGKSIVDQLSQKGTPFAIYHNLVSETKGMREIAYHDHVMKIIDDEILKRDDIETVIFDTWSQFESTLKHVVEKNPSRFKEFWSPNGQIKGGEMWQEAQRYESEIINRILSKVKMLIVTTHLKPYRVGQREVVGKFVPRCQKPIEEKSILRIWLRTNPSGRPIPIGLVLKRLSDRRVTDKGIRTVNILPRKLVPNNNENSIWDVIQRYWENPVGDRPPTVEEIPDEYELGILDGTLTEDQKIALQIALNDSQAELAAIEETAFVKSDDPLLTAIKEFIDSNPDASKSEIMQKVPGATMPLIVKAKAGK